MVPHERRFLAKRGVFQARFTEASHFFKYWNSLHPRTLNFESKATARMLDKQRMKEIKVVK
jgi:hypothetical protein